MRIRRLAPAIRHVQIAGVPDRHEPDTGECDPQHLLRELDAAGYTGWAGGKYRPRAGTLEGSRRMRRCLEHRPEQ